MALKVNELDLEGLKLALISCKVTGPATVGRITTFASFSVTGAVVVIPREPD